MGQRCEEIVELGRSGLLGPDLTLIHCNDMPLEGWRLIAEAGTKITLATTSEQQLGLGSGIPVIQEALDHGIRPSLSGDVEVCLAGDMFTQMRTTLTTQRMLAKARKYRNGEAMPKLIDHRDVIEFATRHAAEAVGLGDQIGTLTPRQICRHHRHPRRGPEQHAAQQRHRTVVLATESKNIDMVFVAGSLRKWQGKLIGQDIDCAAWHGAGLARLHRLAGRLRHQADRAHSGCVTMRSSARHAGSFDAIDDLLTRGT
jgi:cytosine/adenosine deaminase-related metal-dependent hydrolase